ncbi:MAG: hypothetical protein RBS43_10595, partial [Candidatus Cloacimonas sp.]|nr:hypothetical protein [Candidatus Cloacimonas sp.]
MVRAIICAMLLLTVGMVWSETMWPQDAIVRDAQELGYFGTPVKDSNGNVMNAWMKTAGGKYTIYADCYAPDGLSNWTQPLTVKISDNLISDLKVIATSDQAYILSWFEIGEGSPEQLRLQKVSSSGAILWNPEGVLVYDNRVVGYLAHLITPNNEGGAYVFLNPFRQNYILGRYFSASGVEMWGDDAPVIQTAAGLVLNGLVSSGTDGAVLHYTCTTIGMNYIENWHSMGFRQWQNSYAQDPGEQNQPHQIMITDDLKTFDVVKLCNIDTRLKVRVWGSDGSQLLDQPFELQLIDNVQSYVEYNVCLEGQSLTVVFEKQLGTNKEIRFYIVNGMVTTAYPPGGLLLGSNESSVRDLQITYDDTWKYYCSWIEEPLSGYNEVLKANMVDNELQAAWTSDGITLCSCSQGIISYAIQGSNATLSAFANMRENSSSSLVMRRASQNGNLQSTTVDTVLKGGAYPIRTHALGDRTLVFYSDNRDEEQSGAYYQILGPNGERILPDTGVQLWPETPAPYFQTSCEMGNNQVAVLYQNMNMYVQIINYDGSTQYPGYGLMICSSSAYNSMKLSFYQNDLYLGWKALTASNSYSIMGQRISNGQKMWGENGKTIMTIGNTYNFTLTASDGAYYTWYQQSQESTNFSTHALLVDANGDPAPGWSSDGLMIYEDPNDHDLKPFYAQLAGDDLLLVVGGYPSTSGVFAAKVTAGHAVPWGLTGIQLSGTDVLYASCITSSNGMSILTGSANGGIPSVRYQQIDVNGNLLYATPGLVIDQGCTSDRAPNVRLAGFANGGSVAVWVRENF